MEAIDTKSLEDLFEMEITEIQEVAVDYFQKFIRERGLILTNDLHNHFTKSVIVVAQELYAEIRVGFNHYGRFLDLKTMQYKGGKPDPDGGLVLAMKNFIVQKGIGTFNGIPGYYGSNHIPVSNNAINRLAYSMAYSRNNAGIIRRKKQGWYSAGRSLITRDIKQKLHSKIAEIVLNNVSSSLNMTLEG